MRGSSANPAACTEGGGGMKGRLFRLGMAVAAIAVLVDVLGAGKKW